MITRKNLLVAVLSTFCLAAVLFSVVPVNSVGTYDPWIDVKHDGAINVLDLIKVAGGLGTTGDPGLSVSITNWPNATETSVWFGEQVNYYGLSSPVQYANGFAHMNVLADIYPGPDTFTLRIYAYLPNAAHTAQLAIPVYETTFTGASTTACFSIPVPSDMFYFFVYGSSASYWSVYLSYYLTW